MRSEPFVLTWTAVAAGPEEREASGEIIRHFWSKAEQEAAPRVPEPIRPPRPGPVDEPAAVRFSHD